MTSSLRGRLAVWLTSVILILGSLAAGISFALAYHDAQEFQDDELRVIGQLVSVGASDITGRTISDEGEADEEEAIVVTPLGDVNHSTIAAEIHFPLDLADGLQSVFIGGEKWRVFVTKDSQERKVAIAQRAQTRDEAARDSALRTLVPILGLIPILLALVQFVVRKTFRPVSDLSVALDMRREDDLTPLGNVGVPTELEPFLNSINEVFARLDLVLKQQRRFISDAAHELQTPVTALSLQAENLARASDIEEMRNRLRPLSDGIDRLKQLLVQLLSLAKVQIVAQGQDQEVTVFDLIRELIEELLPLIESKSIDLGIDLAKNVTVKSDRTSLLILFRNLLLNAIRYTPAFGKIDLRVFAEADWFVLEIEDTGPGIPPEELERVFDPFFRVPGTSEQGSGLGLTIVKEIADRIGGHIEIRNRGSSGGSGLRVRYTQKAF